MKKILDFKSFLNEAVSLGAKINLPPDVLKHFLNDYKEYSRKFEKSTQSQRILSQIENLPSFESLNTEDVDGDGYEEVIMKVDNKTIVFPFLKYDRGSDRLFLSDDFKTPTKDVIDFVNLLASYGLAPNYLDGKKERLINSLKTKGQRYNSGSYIPYNIEPFQIINDYCQSLVYYVIQDIKETISKSSKKFNPFTDTDLYNNENIKALEKMGTTIDSSPLRVKKGTIVLSNPVYNYDIAITNTGYIRKAEGNGLITTNPELVKPIYNEDDLNVKLVYLRIYTMKRKLKEIGLNSKEIKEIIDLIGKDPQEYSIKAKEVVKLYPQTVLVLPEPEDGFDRDLVKGASILRRFGAFD